MAFSRMMETKSQLEWKVSFLSSQEKKSNLVEEKMWDVDRISFILILSQKERKKETLGWRKFGFGREQGVAKLFPPVNNFSTFFSKDVFPQFVNSGPVSNSEKQESHKYFGNVLNFLIFFLFSFLWVDGDICLFPITSEGSPETNIFPGEQYFPVGGVLARI